MACLCCCISDDEIEGDKFGEYRNLFKVSLQDAPCSDPGCCCTACLCCPCAVYSSRVNALENDMTQYTCCQGYYSPCTKCIDGMDRECPEMCLCLESVCCISCSISATRMMVMDMYEIHSDPCDRKLIRINNVLQMLSCICDIAAMCDPELRECAQCLDFLSQIFYCSLQACMVTQVHVELKHRRGQGDRGGGFVQVPMEEKEGAKAVPVSGVPVSQKIDAKERE